MNMLMPVALLMCVCMAYASALPSPTLSSSYLVDPEAPVESMVPEESRYDVYNGYGRGWGGRGLGGYGGWGWGGRGWGGRGWGNGYGWGGMYG